MIPEAGLSPPTRGSRGTARPVRSDRGSIPAHAGEPRVRSRRSCRPGVYPRPRGGAPGGRRLRERRGGLSPPTRGSHCLDIRRGRPPRSIPAHAGEPRAPAVASCPSAVYPRPRGGAFLTRLQIVGSRGLSPPTRGSPVHPRGSRCHPRSIPAHAGEPLGEVAAREQGWVYPRPRGGAETGPPGSDYNCGLSPPTRGSRVAICPSNWNPGSIPPTRGSRVAICPSNWNPGSIPAHAGEPSHRSTGGFLATVYPRPRGGAPACPPSVLHLHGLSPPTRGSPRVIGAPTQPLRSIPAHAGEPAR